VTNRVEMDGVDEKSIRPLAEDRVVLLLEQVDGQGEVPLSPVVPLRLLLHVLFSANKSGGSRT